LLASLAWGSTVEFTHHHGANSKSGESFSSAAQSTAAVQATATQISPGNPNDSSSKSKTGDECLICQLHQNLSATAIGHLPGVGTTEARGLTSPSVIVVQLSEVTSPGQGRAPPSIL
jgi:hypothetical protein